MLELIDRLFLWVRECRLCYRLTLFTRILLAAGFIPTGMVKLLGGRFTNLPPDNPVGMFFEALYQAGPYWRFIGASQVVAGLLLLWPRGAHLGAALFLPIIVNIFVITISMPFAGTPLITGPMVLAVAYLCLWDFHRFRPLLAAPKPRDTFTRELRVHGLDRWERIGFTVFAISILGFFALTRGFVAPQFLLPLVAAGMAAGVFTLVRFLWTSLSWEGGSLQVKT